MICIECGNPDIKYLYSEYKKKYIKLTICSECGKLADKYIEYDNVILFLDVLLLEPQAYRHLAFNTVEKLIFATTLADAEIRPRYKKLLRYGFLLVLFEVYLMWAYEEKKAHPTKLMAQLLAMSVLQQYSFFIFRQLVERTTMFSLLYLLFTRVLGWGNEHNRNLASSLQKPYFACVLLVTLLISNAIRYLPIIMLIWPYDSALVASAAVNILGFFSTTEGLRINTGRSYSAVFFAVAGAGLCLFAMTEMCMCAWVSTMSLLPASLLWRSTIDAKLESIENVTAMVQKMFSFA